MILTRSSKLPLFWRDQDVVVCILGQAVIGKSTLFNAIHGSGETLLPAGGVGTTDGAGN
jgi:hypothetical protein